MMLNVPTAASAERKFDLDAARRVVGELADLIRPACARLEVGGSIGRGSPYVKDAELIAIPNPGSNLLAWLDGMVERGYIEKALGTDKNGKVFSRWGQKFRKIMFQGIKIDFFIADETNWGFQKWLRTGPGEANTYIMSYLIYRRAAIRFIDGDGWYSPGNLWHKSKDKWVAADKQQLCIPDEETLFMLLGMPYLPPNERSEMRYKQLMGNNRAHRWPDFSQFVLKQPEDVRLVDAPIIIEAEETNVYLGSSAINPFSVTDANAEAWAAQVYAETIARTEARLADCRLMAGTYPSYARRVAVLEGELAMLRRMAQ
jgi:hypothetical protein